MQSGFFDGNLLLTSKAVVSSHVPSGDEKEGFRFLLTEQMKVYFV